MLPKRYRLDGHRIPEVVRRGKRTNGIYSTIVLLKQTDNPSHDPHVTVIVPMRLSKKATERNRTKRILREAVHKHITGIHPGYDIIVMARKLLSNEKLPDVEPEIVQLLQRSGIL